jgi:hypothetical protein
LPANGFQNAAVSTQIKATFDEPMDETTVTDQTFRVVVVGAGSVAGTVTIDEKVTTFTPNPPLAIGEQYEVTITTGVKDAAGNAMEQQYEWTFGTIPDTTPPTVVSVFPANGATLVSAGTPIRATFSEPMDDASVNNTTFFVTGTGGSVGGSVSLDVDVATFTATSPLSPGEYTVTITPGVRDANQLAMKQAFTWRFTTPPLPEANAGDDVAATRGKRVTLDGSASTNPGNSRVYSWSWRQVPKSTVTLNDANTAAPSFIAPGVVSTMKFELVVTNNTGRSAPDTVVVRVFEHGGRTHFVSTRGDDNNPGTLISPKRTIQAAINAADAAGVGGDVYVAEGEYTQLIDLKAGVSVYGGYDESTWLRDASVSITSIKASGFVTNRVVGAVYGSGANNMTLDGLAIESGEGRSTLQGWAGSSVAVTLRASTGVTISNCAITAGAGQGGDNGAPGAPYANRANAGSVGGRGGDCIYSCCNDPTNCSKAGIGGTGTGRQGGDGGPGLNDKGCTGTAGAGNPFSGGLGGGFSGGGDDGRSGSSIGTAGGNGPGSSGFGDADAAGMYRPANEAQNGTIGGPGQGGGGGGGGGGNNFSCGGAGGGGGAGGAGGLQGSKGMSGGASIGLWLVLGSDVAVVNTIITTGDGGVGGAGGEGGAGQPGGFGEAGGVGGGDGKGRGGNGGDGSQGGPGGHGGGGGGGPSVGVALDSGSKYRPSGSTTINLGAGGDPGTSPGNNGARGVATAIKNL